MMLFSNDVKPNVYYVILGRDLAFYLYSIKHF